MGREIHEISEYSKGDRMNQAELLDALARVIGARRSPAGRHKEIKVAFSALKEHLETNWWTRLARKIRGAQ